MKIANHNVITGDTHVKYVRESTESTEWNKIKLK
jgi:hypothetical protein